MPRIKKDGAMREAYEIAEKLNERMSYAEEIRACQAEAEYLYHALLEDEGLLKAARNIAANQTAHPSFQDQIDEVLEEVSILTSKAKLISRKFVKPQEISGWLFKSHSGGKSKAFNIGILKELGYGDISIGGMPLIITEESIDPKIWDAAVAQGRIKLDTATRAGGFVETNKSRRTAFTRAEES